MKKQITLDELGLLYIEYNDIGTFTIADEGWEDFHYVDLSKDNAIRVRDFLTYWLSNDCSSL